MATKPNINRSKIMQRAWELFRSTYSYPAIPFKSIGRHCFASCLKNAWAETKQVAAKAVEPKSDNSQRIAAIHSQIEGLKFKSFRYDIGEMRSNLEDEITQLEAA